MADEEAQNQEQNAEATEAVEAGAEAVEEAPVEEPKAPSLLVPMLLSAIITVVGVGVMVAVVLPKQITKAIAAASAASDTNGTQGQKGSDDSKGGGDDKKGGGDDSKGGGEETADPNAEADDPKKPVSIVPEGESIVVNPANSGGSRYLLVEIFLVREDEKDTGFTKAVESKTKQLQALTADYLTREDVQSLSTPSTKDRLKTQLKLAYEEQLGNAHPIKELIVSKWIMQ